jgi:hydrogenase maturation protease
MEAEGQILVLGVGNPLMADDGAGPAVIELLLSAYQFDDDVTLLDAGTMGFAMLAPIRAARRLIVIDAVRGTSHPVGTVMRMTAEQIAPNQIKHSMHDVTLVEVLQGAELVGSAPETVAIGIQIERLEEAVLELTPAVELAVPIAAAAVVDELTALGVAPTPIEGSDAVARIESAAASYRPSAD